MTEEPRLILRAGAKGVGARGRAEGAEVAVETGAEGEATPVRLTTKAEAGT